MEPPAYFEEVRRRARNRWDQLDADPELAGPWHQLFKQVQSPRHVLSELLQNADDAGATETVVRVDNGCFVFTHNGEDFTEEHFGSLCRFGYSNKRALHTIGFRGIGFKSTFSLGDVVELRTPTLSVCFHRQRFTEPAWLESDDDTNGKTVIRVALSGEHQRREVEKNLEEWLTSPLSLLFFRHIRRMQVGEHEVYWGSLGAGPVPGSEWMALHEHPDNPYLVATSEALPFPDDALSEIRQERLLGIDEATTFPPCRVEIVAGAAGRIYVVLPTGVNTPLPFACNGPFIQDPARLTIKDPATSPTNRWLLERVGQLAAGAMLNWLDPSSGTVSERSGAYQLLPDVDRGATSLDGVCGALVEVSFDAAITGRPFLLAESGGLEAAGECIVVPAALFDVWPEEQAVAILDDRGRHALARDVSVTDRNKLLHWNAIQAFTKDDVLQALRSKHLPKPQTWRGLLNLWAYVAPELTDYRSFGNGRNVRIVPVQGKEVLYSASEVVRLGEKRLLQSDADWDFLAGRLLVLNQNWPRFLTEQRRLSEADDDKRSKEQAEAAFAVLATIELVEASDTGQVLDKVAADFFAADSVVTLAECIQLAQIAAKLGAGVSKQFRFATRDLQLRGTDQTILFDGDGALESFFSQQWCLSHFLHQDYTTSYRSCTSEEWSRWVATGRSGLRSFAPPQSQRKDVWGEPRLAEELRQREFAGSTWRPYVTSNFVVEDWDFEKGFWQHWVASAKDDPSFWGRLVERLFQETWTAARTARVLQVATTGNSKAVTNDSIYPTWILSLRRLPCLRDTRGVYRKPSDLLRRTPVTEPFLDVEYFVHGSIDIEANRPFLNLLSVRDTPVGPERLMACLRALALTDQPPIAEVEKWYRRLDQMLDSCSTVDLSNIKNAFHTEKLVLTEHSGWTSASGAFLAADDEDAPGAAVVRASVRDLALWRRIDVPDRPTADLAIQWLLRLPSGKALDQDEVRRVRALAVRHPQRIWADCGHWLNLANEWAPLPTLKYALTLQSLIPWSHFHQWVKQGTADFQRLPSEITSTVPFSNLPSLADSVEDRLNVASVFSAEPETREWLNRLGEDLCRVEMDDATEAARIRSLAGRLRDTRWLACPVLETTPYIGGTPAGTPRQAEAAWVGDHLHVLQRSAAKVARAVSQELGRAFRRQDVADAIKMCFDRSKEFVTEYLEENFKLRLPIVATDDLSADARTPGPTDPGGQPEKSEGQPAAGDAGTIQLDDAEEGDGETEGVPVDIDESDDEAIVDNDPSHERRVSKPIKATIFERYARSEGFIRDGDSRFYHADGSWIAKVVGAPFPWERRSPAGELLRSYWPKAHCLEREPLQLGADLWGLIEKFPDKYSLILATPSDEPVEVPGEVLRAMLGKGQLTLYPASYRLVVGGLP